MGNNQLPDSKCDASVYESKTVIMAVAKVFSIHVGP